MWRVKAWQDQELFSVLFGCLWHPDVFWSKSSVLHWSGGPEWTVAKVQSETEISRAGTKRSQQCLSRVCAWGQVPPLPSLPLGTGGQQERCRARASFCSSGAVCQRSPRRQEPAARAGDGGRRQDPATSRRWIRLLPPPAPGPAGRGAMWLPRFLPPRHLIRGGARRIAEPSAARRLPQCPGSAALGSAPAGGRAGGGEGAAAAPPPPHGDPGPGGADGAAAAHGTAAATRPPVAGRCGAPRGRQLGSGERRGGTSCPFVPRLGAGFSVRGETGWLAPVPSNAAAARRRWRERVRCPSQLSRVPFFLIPLVSDSTFMRISLILPPASPAPAGCAAALGGEHLCSAPWGPWLCRSLVLLRLQTAEESSVP